MELKDILAIAGWAGLYKYVAQSSRGVIVEALSDKKRSVASATARVSALSEVSMFTIEGDIALSEVFAKVFAHYNGEQAISHKESNDKIVEAFSTVLPTYDQERVHVSDMKKCFAWYNILVAAGVDLSAQESSEQSEQE